MEHLCNPGEPLLANSEIRDVFCWYCSNIINGSFFTVPHSNSTSNNTVVVDGFFCTPGCAKRTVYEKSTENQIIINQCNLLYQEQYALDFSDIICAPTKRCLPGHSPKTWSPSNKKVFNIQKPFKPAVHILVDENKEIMNQRITQ